MLIALTGGIAAGKSTVLTTFAKHGIDVADTDTIVHQIYENNTEWRKRLNERWQIAPNLSGAELREQVAKIVFTNKNELAWLEKALHPLVESEIDNLQKISKNKLIIIAVPLLFEVNWQNKFDYIVTVSCDKEVQAERLLQRGWSQSDINARLKRQFTMKEKEALADFTIVNDFSIEHLEKECLQLLNKFN